MHNHQVAWVAVGIGNDTFTLAVVEKDVAGYVVDPSARQGTFIDVSAAADSANDRSGVSASDAWAILKSSLEASRAAGTRWGPRGIR